MRKCLLAVTLLVLSAVGFCQTRTGGGSAGITPGAACGDASHALSWTGSAYGCQAITGSAAAGGANTQVQFNATNALSGSANLTWVSPALTIGANAAATGQLALANGGVGGVSVTIQNNGATVAYNFNLPTGAGSSGQPLLSGGGGTSAMTFGTLGVAAGGTGQTTLTNHGVLVGAGTSAITQLAAAAAGTILAGGGASADPAFSATPTLGVAGSTTGTLSFSGATSGTVTITPQLVAGTASLTLPNASGTFAVSASAPLALSSTTGALTCATCVTSVSGTTNQITSSGGTTPTLALASPMTTPGAVTVTGALAATTSITSGTNGGTGGSLVLNGATSGAATLNVPTAAGTPTVTFGSSSGTPAVTASSPLAITTATGNITCATCATTTNGGALSGTSPVAISAAGAISITGVAGQVLAGSGPAFTATPTLGVNASSTGQILLANGGAGGASVTIQNNAATVAYNFNLPSGAGSTGQPLLSGGGGAGAMTFGTLGVAAGGTGQTTLTTHGVLLGEGTSGVAAVAAMAADTLLQGQGATSDPAAATLVSCSTTSSALTYNTTTHVFGCNTISGSGTVNSGTASHLAYYAATGTAVSDMGADFTWNGTHSLIAGASGILDLHSAATAGFLLPGALATGIVRVTTSTGAVGSAELSGDVTTSGSNATTIANNAVTAAKSAVVLTRRVCAMIFGADNATSALANADIAPQGRQCFIPYAATVVEVTVAADAGTPNVVPAVNHAGVLSDLVSAALATAASGGIACSNSGGGTGLDGTTTCSSTLQNTSVAAGDYLETHTATAGGTAKRMSVFVTMTVN